MAKHTLRNIWSPSQKGTAFFWINFSGGILQNIAKYCKILQSSSLICDRALFSSPLPLFHPTCRKYIDRVVKYCERKGNEALVKNLVCAGKGVWHYMLACAQAEHVAAIYACKCICLNMSPFPYGLWRFPLSNCVRVVCLCGVLPDQCLATKDFLFDSFPVF